MDPFSEKWADMNFFSPFSLIGKVLSKINHDQANRILIVPVWTTQAWFPVVLRMVVAPPGSSFVKDSLTNKGIPDKTKEIIMSSWRKATCYKYELFLRKWEKFCTKWGSDPYHTNVNNIV